MKKIFAIVFAALCVAGVASAQDFEKATNLAQSANDAMQAGNYDEAIAKFQDAANEAAKCSNEQKTELIFNCKKGICQALYGAANTLINEGQLEEAVKRLEESIATAVEADEEELAQKADTKLNQLHMNIANVKIKAASKEKEAAAKVALYKEAIVHLDAVLAKDAENGKAYLTKGQVMAATGNKDAAIECYTKAAQLGQEKSAGKQLVKIYVKEANDFIKAKKYPQAIASAEKALQYGEDANAYRIAGTAANLNKQPAEAVKYLEKYLQIKPEDEQIKAAVEALKAQVAAQAK